LPLAKDADGVVRVGGTRVTLETIYCTFLEGATAEEVLWRYPSLKLADIYAVFSYCMNFREDVEEYVREREKLAAQVRQENELRFPSEGIREKLLARRLNRR
jgi:uncharacterized protein (DUF433 family)